MLLEPNLNPAPPQPQSADPAYLAGYLAGARDAKDATARREIAILKAVHDELTEQVAHINALRERAARWRS